MIDHKYMNEIGVKHCAECPKDSTNLYCNKCIVRFQINNKNSDKVEIVNRIGYLTDRLNCARDELHRNKIALIELESKLGRDHLDSIAKSHFNHINNNGGEFADLSGIDLSGIDLSGIDLSFMILSRAKLTNVNFSNAQFSYTGFEGACLTNVNFNGAGLIGASFAYADLKNVDFSGSNLSDNNYFKANLVGCNFNNTKLSGVNLNR